MTSTDPYTNPHRTVIEDGQPVRLYPMRDGRWLSRREAEALTPPVDVGVEVKAPSTITVQVVLGVQVDPVVWARWSGVQPVQVPSDVERYVLGLVETEARQHVDDGIRVVLGVRR